MRTLGALLTFALLAGMSPDAEAATSQTNQTKTAKRRRIRRSAAAVAASKAAIRHGAAARSRTATAKALVAAPPVAARAFTGAARFQPANLVNSNAGESQNGPGVENPAALVPFFEQLSHPPASGSLHILHFGDSHTASDDWANTMRVGLQSRFGSGGAGFALAGHPYKGYRRYDLAGGSSEGWRTAGTVGHPGDGRNGLGGVSIETRSAGEAVSVSTDCSQLDLFYLRQPGGGQLQFIIDGTPVDVISTDGDLGPGYFRYSAIPGAHSYMLRTLTDAPVKLFGWVAENRSGITYETLGINGAQATMLLDEDESILADHLAQRDPALIVLAYGTNEAISPHWSSEAYLAAFTAVIERLRRAAPTASILVVGPPDCQFRLQQRHVTYPHLAEVIAVQRQVAYQHGCAFWDWRAHMGGPGSVTEWARSGLAQPDHVHLTTAGYRAIGQMLLAGLMDQYREFQMVRSE